MIGLLLILLPAQSLDDRIAQLYEDCRTADGDSIPRIAKAMQRERTVLLDYFELALPKVTNPNARWWVANKLLPKPGKLQPAAIAAVGAWQENLPRKTLHAILKRTMGDFKYFAETLLAAQALRDVEAFETLGAAGNGIAAAYCLPAKLHAGSAALFLSGEPSILIPACRRAGSTYGIELDVLARRGVTRVREAAADALRRLGKAVPKPSRDRARDTVHILVDLSGHMNWPKSTPDRMHLVWMDVHKRVEAFDEYTRFNVFAFGNGVAAWKQEAAVATPAARRAALRWMQGLPAPAGPANLWAALAYRSADRVLLYAGALPNAGEYKHPAEILIKFRAANRHAQTPVDTFAFAMHDGAKAKRFKKFMKQLAEWTGGTHVAR